MDMLTTVLTNTSGAGLTAALMFLLHRDALKRFSHELRMERQLFRHALRGLGVKMPVTEDDLPFSEASE